LKKCRINQQFKNFYSFEDLAEGEVKIEILKNKPIDKLDVSKIRNIQNAAMSSHLNSFMYNCDLQRASSNFRGGFS